MGVAERKAREKLIRQEQILEAANQVFREVGFYAATMDLVAERAELAKGTIYLYFKSKEELYFSLLLHGFDILVGLLEDLAEQETPSENLLKETAKILFQFYIGHTDYFRLLPVMQNEEMKAKLSPEVSEEFNKRARTILNIFSKQIKALSNDGKFVDVNSWHVANILWGAFNGIIHLALTKEQLQVPATHIDDLLSLCFELINRGLSLNHKESNNTVLKPQSLAGNTTDTSRG